MSSGSNCRQIGFHDGCRGRCGRCKLWGVAPLSLSLPGLVSRVLPFFFLNFCPSCGRLKSAIRCCTPVGGFDGGCKTSGATSHRSVAQGPWHAGLRSTGTSLSCPIPRLPVHCSTDNAQPKNIVTRSRPASTNGADGVENGAARLGNWRPEDTAPFSKTTALGRCAVLFLSCNATMAIPEKLHAFRVAQGASASQHASRRGRLMSRTSPGSRAAVRLGQSLGLAVRLCAALTRTVIRGLPLRSTTRARGQLKAQQRCRPGIMPLSVLLRA